MGNQAQTRRRQGQENGNGSDEQKAALAERVQQQRDEADRQRERIRKDADAILGDDWDGTLTKAHLRKLYPLLQEPVPQHYVEFTPKTEGKPYDSTGLRSVQVQIDRLNDVLGPSGWRTLIHYTQNGQVARAHVIVGNDLNNAWLGEDGDLITRRVSGTAADVLAHREGYGGHKRGSAPGDIYKGSETNTLKRVIARLGPGREVYALDADDDVQLSAEGEYQPPRQQTQRQGDGQRRQQTPAKPPEEELRELLEKDDALKQKRADIHNGMDVLGVKPAQQVRELKAARNARDMDALEQRINVAVDTQEASSGGGQHGGNN